LSDAQRQGNFNANAARDAHEAAAELSTRGEGEEEGIRRNCLNSGGSWIGDTSSGYCKMPEDVAVTGPTDPGGGGTPKPKPKPKPKPPGGPNPDIKPSPIPGITPTGPADTATILGDTYDYMYNWRPVTPGQGMNPLVDPNAWLHQVDPKWQRIRDPGIYVNPAINVGMMPQQARATNATMSRNTYSLLG
jgi:hypothetical protein